MQSSSLSDSDSFFFSSFSSFAASGAAAAGAAAAGAAPPPDGTEASFSLPSARTSAMALPESSEMKVKKNLPLFHLVVVLPQLQLLQLLLPLKLQRRKRRRRRKSRSLKVTTIAWALVSLMTKHSHFCSLPVQK
jgi:hypothetical protein